MRLICMILFIPYLAIKSIRERISVSIASRMLRKEYLCFFGARISASCKISPGVKVNGKRNLTLNDNVFVGSNCTFVCYEEPIVIGKNTLIAQDCFIITRNHKFNVDSPIREQGYTNNPVKIGDDVWIGAKCVILPGVNIGNGAIVAAGSVVTRSVASHHVVGGVPARVISVRR
ncbi:acyltransferase [Pseudidiomarina donghaiensis]|uniref:Acyltransferase n=1 Tax=Pseudidiomarina donghaiensis TaxID=519452 RepID=A0A432XKU6_9GAMM|nr:acyltransferase [Pseudidiomarina donghaiensis]RUO49321.1 acyltransferase [Pseudidiomarina donghaiensis]SFV20986.1 maltose O-acetyltransferase [Pseudidiomarina donghaiensis]